MTERKVRIAQVGVKNHGATILEATLAAGNLEIVSLYDIDKQAARRAASACGAAVAESLKEILSDPRAEAVSLVTPNHLHAEETLLAASAGKHIFVEKPMAQSVSEARRMLTITRTSGLILSVGHNTRRRRVFRRAKQILSEGSLGTIVAAEMNLSRPAGLQSGLPGWKADPRKCPLLPMSQLGIHFADTIEYLIAPIGRVSCFASSRAMPGDVQDAVVALLELTGEIPATLSSFYVTPDVYIVRIYGTGGILTLTPLSLTLELAREGEIRETHRESFEGEGPESYVLEMREFGKCILAGTLPETGGLEGLRAVAAVEAMVESDRTGRAVDISQILGSP